ncbi:type III polyketide synthase [Microscilla marina]|uniref:Naringenin-chalcone synthase n=1 Tax=Microscilla marina ATCC 23134 TaxID=313606 RepID=A1ZN71_MICM2|nr:type III polyketide synthase [Microscilla marina]EAY28252.1 naringenin-chalcone synthase [Microscilla marina ATCC 23134]
MNKTYIHSIGTANPVHQIAQQTTAEFMVKFLELSPREARKLQLLYRATSIDYRYSVLEDYAKTNDFDFYPNTGNTFPSTAQRMQQYEKHAATLATAAVANCLPANFSVTEITHLITVSCTGMYAPGLDIELVEKLGLAHSVQRTCINFMGCYAAFNALKIADIICRATPKAKVLVVGVELCTLHFQKSTAKDDLVANAIFADGAAAVLLQGHPPAHKAIALEGFYCDLEPDGKGDMAWHIKDHGFEMKLSSYVPQLLEGKLKALVGRLLQNYQLNMPDIELFAIHPGGRRILERIEQSLGIPKKANATAYEVLQQYGNMSSVTVLFVLKRLLEQVGEEHHDQRILSMAFGPGLTLESALMKVFCPND